MWDIFQTEALERLLELEEALLEAEASGVHAEHIATIYRALHTFKGNSRIMGLSKLEGLAHLSEDLMGLIRDQGLPFTRHVTQILFEALDVFRELTAWVCEHKQDITPDHGRELGQRLNAVLSEYQSSLEGDKPTTVESAVQDEAEQNELFQNIYLEMLKDDLPRLKESVLAAHAGNQSGFDISHDILEGWLFATRNVGYDSLIILLEASLKALDTHDYQTLEITLTQFQIALTDLNQTESVASNLADQATLRIEIDELSFFKELETEITLLIEGIQQLLQAEVNDPSLCIEALDQLVAASQALNYIRLYELCLPLREAILTPPEPDILRELEYQFFRELTAIQSSLIQRYGQEHVDSPLQNVFEQWHAVHFFKHISDINSVVTALLKSAILELPEHMNQAVLPQGVSAIKKLFESLCQASQIYELTEAKNILLTLEDLILRMYQKQIAFQPRILELCLNFLSQLQTHLESTTPEATVPWLDFQQTLQAIPFADGESHAQEWITRLKLNPAYAEVLNQENLNLLSHCMQKQMHGYLITANLTLSPELSEAFYTWLSNDLLVPITNITLYENTTSSFQFLVFSLLNLTEMDIELSQIDPSRQAQIEELDIFDKPSEDRLNSSVAMPSQNTRSASNNQIENNLLKVDLHKVNRLMDLAGEIGLAAGGLINHPELSQLNLTGFQIASQNLTTLIRELQGETSSLRLVPVSVVFKRMERLVRDLKHTTNKQIELVISGESTEIDKMMADKLYDPLVHMIRNAVDHGIETPEQRLKQGKSATGKLYLNAMHQAGEVVIQLSDDGHGLDRQAILKRAREQGLWQADEDPEEAILFKLIFQPGFSTAKQLSHLSGRGVGLDIVKHTMTELRGRYHIKSQDGQGTQISLHLPLTLAFIEGMIIEVANTCYAIPIESIHEVFKVQMSQVTHLATEKAELIKVRNEFIPTCWLEKFYHHENAKDCRLNTEKVIVVTQSSRGNLAIPVDKLVGNQQVTLKPLSGLTKAIRAGAGYGLLSSGDVALVLDCERLHAS